jgi:hypothetical protein
MSLPSIRLLDDCTYSTTSFSIPFSMRLDGRWWLREQTPGRLQLDAALPNPPANADELALQFIALDRVFDQPCHARDVQPSTSHVYSAGTGGPEAFWTWLAKTVPMVSFETPASATIGGKPALQAVSTTKVNQLSAACQGSWWVDIADLRPAENLAIAENPGADRLAAVVVDRKTLLIAVEVRSPGPGNASDTAFFPTLATAADQVLATVQFR